MAAAAPVRQQVQRCIGRSGWAVGSLVYVRQGRRENTNFALNELQALAALAEVHAAVAKR